MLACLRVLRFCIYTPKCRNFTFTPRSDGGFCAITWSMRCSNRFECTLDDAVCSTLSSRGDAAAKCTSASAKRTLSVLAYPRWAPDTAVARAGVVETGSDLGDSSFSTCVRIERTALIVPPVPAHTFHFFMEFAFHLFSALQALSPPPDLILLPQPNSSSSSGRLRLDPFKSRIWRALLSRAHAVHRLPPSGVRLSPPLRPLCVRRLIIGMAVEVALSASACYRIAHARALGTCQLASSTLLDGFAPFRTSFGSSGRRDDAAHAADSLAGLRRLSNCTLTRRRLREFGAFVRAHLAVASAPGHAGRRLGREAGAHGVAGTASRPALRILFVQRELRGRRIVDMQGLVSSVRAQLQQLQTPRRLDVHTVVGDFGSDQQANARLLERANVLVAAHGNALSNVMLGPQKGLRAVLQLMPSCLPNGTYSMRAYEVLGRVLAGQARSLCCVCTEGTLGKASPIQCNASEVATALASMLS